MKVEELEIGAWGPARFNDVKRVPEVLVLAVHAKAFLGSFVCEHKYSPPLGKFLD